jgi:hypothetical protein
VPKLDLETLSKRRQALQGSEFVVDPAAATCTDRSLLCINHSRGEIVTLAGTPAIL